MKNLILGLLILTNLYFLTVRLSPQKVMVLELTTSDPCAPEEFRVTATCYNAVESQCDLEPNITSWGKRISADAYSHKYISVSRDLLDKFPYGSKVLIKGTPYDGLYIVADLMNKRFSKRVDLLIDQEMKVFKADAIISLMN